MKIRVILGLLVIVGLVYGMGLRASRAEEEPVVGANAATTVRVALAEPTNTTEVRTFSGSLRSVRRAQLSFTVSGRLVSRPVELGDTVQPGDLLAQLDQAPLRSRVASARASVNQAGARLVQGKRERARAEHLLQARALASAEFDDASSAVEVLAATRSAARVNAREARRMLGESVLSAPFAAVVAEVLVQPGEFVAAGTPIVELNGTDGLELEVEVSEDVIQDLSVGDSLEVSLPRQAGRRIGAVVSAVGHAAPQRGRLFPVIVRLEAAEGLAPGVTAVLAVPRPETHMLSVPVEAVINPGGMHPAVFRVQDGVAQRVEVDVSRISGTRALIRRGLERDQQVVISGQNGLVPGATVTVLR